MPSPVPSPSRVALITAPDAATARVLARALVERSIAACVNVVPGVASIYRWKGALEEASEVLMVVKTTAARVADVEALLIELHPYDVPELIVLEPAHVEAKYLRWLQSETGAAPAQG